MAFTAGPEDADRLELDGTRLPVGVSRRGQSIDLAFAVGERVSHRHRAKRLVGVALGTSSWPEALPEELDPELVVHDGERGLGPAVDRRYPGARAQRCAWHLLHKLKHQLWRGEWPKEEPTQRVGELAQHLFGPAPPDATRRVAIWEWAEHHFAPGSPGPPRPPAGSLASGAIPGGSPTRTGWTGGRRWGRRGVRSTLSWATLHGVQVSGQRAACQAPARGGAALLVGRQDFDDVTAEGEIAPDGSRVNLFPIEIPVECRGATGPIYVPDEAGVAVLITCVDSDNYFVTRSQIDFGG